MQAVCTALGLTLPNAIIFADGGLQALRGLAACRSAQAALMDPAPEASSGGCWGWPLPRPACMAKRGNGHVPPPRSGAPLGEDERMGRVVTPTLLEHIQYLPSHPCLICL